MYQEISSHCESPVYFFDSDAMSLASLLSPDKNEAQLSHRKFELVMTCEASDQTISASSRNDLKIAMPFAPVRVILQC